MTAEELKEAKKKINDLLSPCKANTFVQPVNDSVMSDKEIASYLRVAPERISQLKQNWVSNFIQSGGVALLLSILNDLNAISQTKPKAEVLKSKLEKECWMHVLRILRVLLMSAFIAKQAQSF